MTAPVDRQAKEALVRAAQAVNFAHTRVSRWAPSPRRRRLLLAELAEASRQIAEVLGQINGGK